MTSPWVQRPDQDGDGSGWRTFISGRMAILFLLFALAFVALMTWQIAHGRQVCTPPNVPISYLDPRIPLDACATISPDKTFHGVWVDTKVGAIFYPGADKLPREGKGIKPTDAWLIFDPHVRESIDRDLPKADRALLAAQTIAISFHGVEYVLDRATRDGARRFFDVRRVRTVRLLQRHYNSARSRNRG